MNAAIPLSAMSRDQQQAWLQSTLGFDQLDLQTNRAGGLSDKQQQKMSAIGLLALVFSLGFPLMCIVPFGLLGLASLFPGAPDDYRTGLLCLCPACSIYLITLFVLPASIQRLRDARDGQALVAAGQCRIIQSHHWPLRSRPGYTNTLCVVGGQILTVTGRAPSRQAVAQMQGQVWRCYYAPHTKFLMSIEPA